MKRILFILLLLPFISNAQTDPAEVKSDGKLNLTHSNKTVTVPAARKEGDKRKLKDDEVYTGNVKFKIGGNEISCDSAILYKNDDKLSAFHVIITNPVSFVIKGDNLNFDKEKVTGTLTSNISVTAMNGNVVGTSDNFELDFSYDVYRIINGSMIPPPHADAGH